MVRKLLKITKMDGLAFTVVAFIFAPLIWWAADRTPPIDVIRYGLIPKKVAPGATIYRDIEIIRLRHCETDPDTIMIDGARVRWNFEEPAITSPGQLGHDHYRRPVVIPLQASPGQAQMRTTVTYICNPLHRIWPIKLIQKPLEFEIAE